MNYHEHSYGLDLEADLADIEAYKRTQRCELIKEQIVELYQRIEVLQAMLERERGI
jgi:hypothetical protein